MSFCPDCGYPDPSRQHDGIYTPGEACPLCEFNERAHRPHAAKASSLFNRGKLENVYLRPDGRFDFLPEEPN